jgi:hypothetical protein
MVTLQPFARLIVLVLGVVTLLLTPASIEQPSRPSAEKIWRVVVLNNADFLLPASASMDLYA